jgi:hypothetical protein
MRSATTSGCSTTLVAWLTTPGARGRIYVAKLGPVGSAVLFPVIGILAVLALFLLLGVALISLAVIGVLTVGAIVSAVWRGRSRRIGWQGV